MADTLIRLRADPGKTVVTQLEDEQGQVYDQVLGAFAPLVVANWADYDLATPETPPGSGRYVLDVATLGSGALAITSGIYSWIQFYQGVAPPAPGRPLVGYGERYWDGSTFSPSPPSSTTFDGLAAFGNVIDPNPTARSFVMSLSGAAPVPEDGDWIQLFACFTTGRNAQAKRQITGYRKLTDTTALVTVGSDFPTPPANGDALTIL